MTKYTNKEIMEFLTESNAIECVYDNMSLAEAHDAWNYAFKFRTKLDFDKIMEIHRLLLQRQRPDIAGHLRNCDVMVGGQIKPFISYALLKENLNNWLEGFKLDKKGVPKREWSNVLMNNHIAFEDLHPFEDGNGRVGRILWNIQRYNNGLPILIIHEGDEQRDYYEIFKKI